MTEPLSTRLSARSEASMRLSSGYHIGGAFKHVRVCGGSSANQRPTDMLPVAPTKSVPVQGLRAMVCYRTKRLPRCRLHLCA
jgi:hypothetical protein